MKTSLHNLRLASAFELPKIVYFIRKRAYSSRLKGPESLSVPFEIVRLSGAGTHNLVEDIVQMILKVSGSAQQLWEDNEYLKYHEKEENTVFLTFEATSFLGNKL